MDKRIVIVCRHLAKGEASLAFAFRSKPESAEDSGWQCLCGQEHDMSDAMVVSMDEAIQLCPQLEAIKDEPYPSSFAMDASSDSFKKQ